MPTTFANTIDGCDIYAKRAEEDQSGVNIEQNYAKKTEIPDGIPAVTSSDDGKVLKASYSGGQGSYAWENESGGSTELFEAIYGTTSYADVTAAIAAKKTVFCRVSASNPSRMAFLAYIGSTNVEFQYYRSLNSHSATNQVDEVYVYTVSSSGWTTTTRKAGCNVAAGTGLSRAYNSDTITLSVSDPIPAVTSSDNGKVLKASYSGGQGSYAWGDDDTGVVMVEYGDTTKSVAQLQALLTAGQEVVAYRDITESGVTRRYFYTLNNNYEAAAANMPYLDFSRIDLTSVDSSTGAYGTMTSIYYQTNGQGVDVWDTGVIRRIKQANWDETSTTDPSYIRNKPTISNVPDVTSSDDGKVLKASYSGGTGSYSWQTESGGGSLPSSTSADEGKALVVDSNGDPQWTAPKAVSAGTGIKITEASNTVTVAHDETVLYDSGTSSSVDSCTLSESFKNFEYMKVYFRNGDGDVECKEYISSLLASVITVFNGTISTEPKFYAKISTYTVTNTTLTHRNSIYYTLAPGVTPGAPSNSANALWYIRRVVGINRIYT